MKILHTADWHIGQFKGPVVDGVNLRSQDTVKCLEYMVQVAIEEKPDIVCVSGDIFHQEQVGPVRYSDEMITASPPGVRSGNLRRNWNMYSSGGGGNGIFGIQSGMHYSEYPEHGTSKMAARPYVEKIKETAMPEILALFSELGG